MGATTTWKMSFIALRITSVYVIVRALILAAENGEVLTFGGGGAGRWAIVAADAGLLLTGVVLWWISYLIADRIAADAEDSDPGDEDKAATSPPSSLDTTTIVSIALSVLGIILIVDGITSLVITVGTLIEASRPQYAGTSLAPLYWRIFASGIRGGAGVWLLVGSRPIVSWINRLRVQPVVDSDE